MNRIFDFKGESTDFVSDIIMPNIEIKRVCNIIKRGLEDNTASTTIYTTPADKDFYIVGLSLNYSKDITATSTSFGINAVIEGASTPILNLRGSTLTVQNEATSISLPNAIKVDRNTAITLTATNATANHSASAIIYGYTVETTKGI